ncbi:segregation and condensation protein B [Filimonas lacunae]|uniref:Segregation and condensation protein B n=1 Tax=Filimonas lacunae TaxID=477680 RepID=A0A173M9L0_9BACT|nr:SMC-Scp complex subunit ScpB [Filimonas lacunae]BAV04200.1 segregation and condensation protein B [Filimonas lacunae]SIT14292.1 segregation and condensation protein B [Filimonas lacunae]
MELSEIIPHIEVLIFASEKPLTSPDIVELINNAFGFMEQRITLEQVESCMENIADKYESEFFPFEVRESGGGWQFLTKKTFHKTVAQLNGDKFLKRLSNAAMETLAIIAYKQPITKGEIEGIRGVNSDYSIQKLLEKELIVISGRSEELPGKPLIYSTSKTFMDYFGINSAEDLPKIKEVLAEQMVEATVVNGITTSSEENIVHEEEEAVVVQSEIPLAVDSSGALIPVDDLDGDSDVEASETTEAAEPSEYEASISETQAGVSEEDETDTEDIEQEEADEEATTSGEEEDEADEEDAFDDEEEEDEDNTPDNNEDGHQDDEPSGEHPEQK